mmetsp:Transcript_32308/g.67667  ORF Transcript_32308/g.67667 Transcript_32308/m.67667 type:complete len:135 (-) Transcript_32308:459-863(-)
MNNTPLFTSSAACESAQPPTKKHESGLGVPSEVLSLMNRVNLEGARKKHEDEVAWSSDRFLPHSHHTMRRHISNGKAHIQVRQAKILVQQDTVSFRRAKVPEDSFLATKPRVLTERGSMSDPTHRRDVRICRAG